MSLKSKQKNNRPGPKTATISVFSTLMEIMQEIIKLALNEDIGSGDITAKLIPESAQISATVISREPAVICGQSYFNAVFAELDTDIRIDWLVKECSEVKADTYLCTLTGNARHILTGERTALNFLQTLSATATQVKPFVDAIHGTQAKILDTRKTIPGLRVAQKYAISCGGGQNHRMGLYDGILIKENHILAAGGIQAAVTQAKTNNPEIPVEVEVENVAELQQALAAGADIIMLDNMSTTQMREAVQITQGRAKLEASGNVDINNVRDIAETGVDFISIGGLTKHIHAVDLSMRFEPLQS